MYFCRLRSLLGFKTPQSDCACAPLAADPRIGGQTRCGFWQVFRVVMRSMDFRRLVAFREQVRATKASLLAVTRRHASPSWNVVATRSPALRHRGGVSDGDCDQFRFDDGSCALVRDRGSQGSGRVSRLASLFDRQYSRDVLLSHQGAEEHEGIGRFRFQPFTVARVFSCKARGDCGILSATGGEICDERSSGGAALVREQDLRCGSGVAVRDCHLESGGANGVDRHGDDTYHNCSLVPVRTKDVATDTAYITSTFAHAPTVRLAGHINFSPLLARAVRPPPGLECSLEQPAVATAWSGSGCGPPCQHASGVGDDASQATASHHDTGRQDASIKSSSIVDQQVSLHDGTATCTQKLDTSISYGSDCTGLDAPFIAIIQACRCHCSFASECDEKLRDIVMHSSRPDVMTRDFLRTDAASRPVVDIYVCGFPCQPYSLAGGRLGSHDRRSGFLPQILNYLRNSPPKSFILENVAGFRSIGGGIVFRDFLSDLNEIGLYHITWQMISPSDHGIGASRPRLFIIGVLRTLADGGFPRLDGLSDAPLFEDLLVASQPAGERLQWSTSVLRHGPPSLPWSGNLVRLERM